MQPLRSSEVCCDTGETVVCGILSTTMPEKHWSPLRVIDWPDELKILFFRNMKIVGWSFYWDDFLFYFPFLFKKFVCLFVWLYVLSSIDSKSKWLDSKISCDFVFEFHFALWRSIYNSNKKIISDMSSWQAGSADKSAAAESGTLLCWSLESFCRRKDQPPAHCLLTSVHMLSVLASACCSDATQDLKQLRGGKDLFS